MTMNDTTSFQEPVRRGGRRQRTLTGLVVLLAVGLIGIGLAEPWAPHDTPGSPSPAASAPSAVPSAANATGAPASGAGATLGTPSAAFSLPVPPPATASWTRLRWTRVARNPLSLVESVLRWGHGFIALGRNTAGTTTTTPIWTSDDGQSWTLLPFNTSTTFWPGAVVLGVVEVPAGLVAVTGLDVHDCGLAPCPQWYAPPIVSWTTPNGRDWSPGAFPDIGLDGPMAGRLVVVSGPAGILAISTGDTPHAATSPDGREWTAVPGDAFPPDFVVVDVVGTASGYVAGGQLVGGQAEAEAATMWSADGRTWSAPQVLPGGSGSTVETPANGSVATVMSLVAGRDGLLAIGNSLTTPGAARWWQSPDGRDWVELSGHPAVELGDCGGCGDAPPGILVGDGERMVAIGGAPGSGAWISTDGLLWRALPAEGVQPSGLEIHATILPGGVLLSDGRDTWLGQAIVD
jgi:hypothetical protein